VTGQSGTAILSGGSRSRQHPLLDWQASARLLSRPWPCGWPSRARSASRSTLQVRAHIPQCQQPHHVRASCSTIASGIRDVFDSTSMDKADPLRIRAASGPWPRSWPGSASRTSPRDTATLLEHELHPARPCDRDGGPGRPSPLSSARSLLDPLGMKTHWFPALRRRSPPTNNFAHGYMNTASKPRDVSAGQKMLPYNSEATWPGPQAGSSRPRPTWRSGPPLLRRRRSGRGGAGVDDRRLADAAVQAPVPVTDFGFERATIAKQMAWGHRGHLDGFWSAMWLSAATSA